ncbi:MAG TPA: sulfotransferase [Acidobacteriota bacterium]|nr:sulfotransferase [Acidobacteriota bacterium]
MNERDVFNTVRVFGSVPQPEARLVFVVGCPRSGTTWVLGILESHDDVAIATPETLGLKDTSEHGSRESKLFIGKDFDAIHKSLGAIYSQREAKEMAFSVGAHALVRLAEKSGAKVIVEKTPTHLWRAHEIAHFFPESRFINVLRDGRDVCVSMLEAHKGWGRDWAPGTLEEAAKLWSDSVELAKKMEEKLPPERWITVRYKDLLREPIDSIIRLFEFAGLPVERGEAAAIHEENRGGAKAWFKGVFRKGISGEWKRFSAEDRKKFNDIAGRQLISSGYETSEEWIEDAGE